LQIEEYCIESEFNHCTNYVKVFDIIKLNDVRDHAF